MPKVEPKVFWCTTDKRLVRLYQGDVLDVLSRLPDQSVHMVVTSPPYWGLRDYGTAEWEGGDEKCPHIKMATGGNPKQGKNKGNNAELGTPFKSVCGLCGAKRIDQQIGSEQTPDEFVAKMVEVFGEIKRVLRDDGTCWLNLGSTFVSKKIESDEMVLRDDITEEERRYVFEELAKCV